MVYATLAFRVLRLDDSGFWDDLPGGKEFAEDWRAIYAAETYFQKTLQPTRVVNCRAAIIWDSSDGGSSRIGAPTLKHAAHP